MWVQPEILYPFSPGQTEIAGFSRLYVDTSESQPVRLAVSDQGEGAVVLFFMGNAGNLGAFLPWLELHQNAGHRVVAMEYRGGAGVSGTPSEVGLKTDALVAYDWVRDQYEEMPIILHGYSLGSGLAMHVAAQRSVTGVVLEAPYSSICQMMQRLAWVPACHMPFVQRWESVKDAPKVGAPIFMVHGDADTVIPIAENTELRAALTEAQLSYLVIPGATHTNLPSFPTYQRHISDFIAQSLR